MAILDGYTTLAGFKSWAKITSTDATDDTLIEQIIEAASRAIDGVTGRRFNPLVMTRNYDTPEGRELWLDDDLAAVTTLTNGDDSVIASTDYVLLPSNAYPKYSIKLRDSSDEAWEVDDDASSEQVINVLGIWVYRDRYNTLGWLTGSTANEDIDASETVITMTSGTPFAIGNIVKCENELWYVSGVSTNDLTVTRGYLGSTATTHATATACTIWSVQPEIVDACNIITGDLYRRFGENEGGVATVTAAGIVISPAGLPTKALALLRPFIRSTP